MRRLLATFLLPMGAAVAMCAHAGKLVSIDAAGGTYADRGQQWNSVINYDPGSGVTGGTVSFDLNFGAGSTRDFTFDPHGQITFGNGNFIAPLLAPQEWQPDPTSGLLMWGSGLIDPRLLAEGQPNGLYDIGDALSAYRFTWAFVCQGACDIGVPEYTFQALLLDRGNGDFDLDFNYFPSSDLPGSFTAGYRLGSNVASFTPPSNGIGPDYCFRGGVGSLCGTTAPVPEPSTGAAIALGLAALTAWRRRQAHPARGAAIG